MPSQKLRGWLSKNFVLQGLVVFHGRRHFNQVCRGAVTLENGLFATPANVIFSISKAGAKRSYIFLCDSDFPIA